MPTPQDFTDRLGDALARMHWEDVSDVVTEVVRFVADEHRAGRHYPFKDAAHVLGELRKKRRFEDMERAAAAFLEAGQDHPRVQRQLVQALIDQGELTSALAEVSKLVERTSGNPEDDEWAEARGLRGRTLKQLYVDAGPEPGPRVQTYLCDAVASYHEAFRVDEAKHYWHGINVVACLARADRDGVRCSIDLDWRALARQIRTRIDSMDKTNPYNMWAWATAFEASVALNEVDVAGQWLNRYLSSNLADAFEFMSTHRQLVQVWQLANGDGGGRDSGEGDDGGGRSDLLAPLRTGILHKSGGSLELAGDDGVGRQGLSGDRLERHANYGNTVLRNTKWYDRFSRKWKAVARVEHANHSSVGTAFVVPGEEFRSEWKGVSLVVTANHVIKDEGKDGDGLQPSAARLRFTRLSQDNDGRTRVRCLWACPDLDASVLLPEALPDGVGGINFMPMKNIRLDADEPPELFVVGHPGGRGIEFATEDNRAEALEDPHLIYRSPTHKGHSGAPVLNDEFDAVAVHIGACDDREANVGVLAERVLEAVRKKNPSLTPSPDP